MNDFTNQEPQATAAPQPTQPPPPVRVIPFVPVKVVDGRAPFAPLATLQLSVIPRPGDSITIDLAGRRVTYHVGFVSIDPYDPVAHVTLGCSAPQPVTAEGQADPAKINAFIQQQDQFFQKAEAYSKTIIALGYAGLFAVWSFVKDHLSHRAMVLTAALVGFSLIIYIAWEVYLMINRALLHDRFNKTLKANPADQAKAIGDYLEQARNSGIRGAAIWKGVLVLTVLPGSAGAFVLLYNVFADLIGLPQP
jgi:hypothetical protein